MSGSHLLMIIIFFLFSTIFGMFGIGGGAIYTPVQLLFDAPFNEAATLTLFFITVTALSSGYIYIRAKLVDTLLVTVLALSSFIGSFFGGWGAHLIPEPLLVGLFSFFLFANGLVLATSRTVAGTPSLRPAGYLCWERVVAGEKIRVFLPLALPTAFFSGVLGGMVGLGGGIVMLPLMIVMLHFPVKVSIACSAFLAAATGLGGFLSRLGHASIDLPFALAAAVAIAAGSILGARRTVQVKGAKIQKLLGYFFIAIALFMFLRGA